MSDPQLAMARDVIDRLDLRGDERVLDAGCGTGRVTEVLAERVPDGDVIAVDGSEAMVEQTRKRSAPVTAFTADLVELTLDEPVDAILSTATFHWIADHERLFARLHAALKPGGRLAAQCGGAGNIANVQAAIDAVDHPALRGWAGPWNYATPEEPAATPESSRLHRRLDMAAALARRPARPARVLHDRDPRLASRAHDEDERAPFVDAVLSQLDEPVRANYVRLNLLARR